MEKDFLQEFIHQVAKENKKLDKVISIRMTNSEYEILLQKQEKHPLKLSTYIRNILFEKELKINEFQTDEVLLQYGAHFKKITNLLRNREWNAIENKKEILMRIENLIELIHQYLYIKIQKNE